MNFGPLKPILTYDVKKLSLFILAGGELAADNQSYSIAFIQLQIKIEYWQYVCLGRKRSGRDILVYPMVALIDY